MNNKELIEHFYQSFANRDVEGMVSCYDDNILFEDPAFGQLKGGDAKDMWRMLISRGDGTTKITCSDVQADKNLGSANWRAEYFYGPNKRKVINNITATYEFEKGKIIKHTDHFDLWKWSKQALGISGYLLGWSSFMRNKINKHTNSMLHKFQENSRIKN